jgi:hypothetical protein
MDIWIVIGYLLFPLGILGGIFVIWLASRENREKLGIEGEKGKGKEDVSK